MIAEVGIAPARDEVRWMLGRCRAPKLRTRREFAEQELILPAGPFEGRRFKASRQPFAGLWLDAVDGSLTYQLSGSQRFQRIATTGPSQSGKSLLGTVIPVLYHLFEIGETVGFALPDMRMAEDKYRKDILPALLKTRYRDLLPSRGEGSEGGKVNNMVTFRNGASLKFFSAGGSDKSRSHFTTRVLVITEANAFGSMAEASNESNKLEQLLARVRSFGSSALVYLECTVEVETDVIWTNYSQGSKSRIACPCPHCRSYVTPEREQLAGWQDAASAEEAEEKSHWVCPSCTGKIDEAQRRAMNERALLVHRDQSIECKRGKPVIAGEQLKTRTLGFRWNAFNNLFATAADLGAEEWRDARSPDEEAAERKQHQFVWCVPHQSDVVDVASLNANELTGRQWTTPKGLIPQDAVYVTAAADLGKWASWYLAIAWSRLAGDGWRGVVFDYEKVEMDSTRLGVEPAILSFLRTIRDKCETGWVWEGHGEPRSADVVAIDAGWQGGPEGPHQAIYQFIRECQASKATHDRYWACKGFGEGQFAGSNYHAHKKSGAAVALVGDSYHVAPQPASGVNLIEWDADAWKTFLHERLACDCSASAILLHQAIPKQHLTIARHWTAEIQKTEFIAGRGEVTKWQRQGKRPNHLLDTSAMASMIAHLVGVRIVRERKVESRREKSPEAAERPAVQTPDGRPYLITER